MKLSVYGERTIGLERYCEMSELLQLFKEFQGRKIAIYGLSTETEKVFHCGASSKDAGARITTINEIFSVQMYDTMIGSLINNSDLQLK